MAEMLQRVLGPCELQQYTRLVLSGAVKTALAQFANTDYCHDVMQHPELGKSRAQRDHRDLLKLLYFLESHNPLQSLDSRLHCLTSGIAAVESDNISCDDTEKVGAGIMLHVDGMNFSDVHLKLKIRSEH